MVHSTTQRPALRGDGRRASAGSGAVVPRSLVARTVRATPLPPPPPVCLYTPSADPSGMGQHMLDLAECYVERGGEVTVMAWPTEPGKRMLARAARAGATPVRIPHPRDPAFAPFITDHLRAHPVQVFHAHVGTGRENFDGARAARAADVPAVVQTLHLPWMLSSPKKRVPFFEAIADVDRLLTVSEGQRASYERIGVPSDLMSTVPNGVRPRGPGLGRAEARRELGLTADQPVVLSVGRLTVMKGQRYLVDCLPRLVDEHPDLAVVLIGAGHLQDSLAAQAAELGVAHALHLVGHRPDARALLDAADVFVLPSLHEGMPLAAMEAMDAGLPVVGTRVVGTSEIVLPGVTGELVRPRDARGLGDALARVLGDPERRAAQGAAGERRFREQFTSSRMAGRTIAVYEGVLGTAASVPEPRR